MDKKFKKMTMWTKDAGKR